MAIEAEQRQKHPLQESRFVEDSIEFRPSTREVKSSRHLLQNPCSKALQLLLGMLFQAALYYGKISLIFQLFNAFYLYINRLIFCVGVFWKGSGAICNLLILLKSANCALRSTLFCSIISLILDCGMCSASSASKSG